MNDAPAPVTVPAPSPNPPNLVDLIIAQYEDDVRALQVLTRSFRLRVEELRKTVPEMKARAGKKRAGRRTKPSVGNPAPPRERPAGQEGGGSPP